jgi:hypothetical protein
MSPSGAMCLLEVRMVDRDFTRKAMMAVVVGDVAFVLHVPAVVTELALTQEVTEFCVVVFTSAPFTECLAACGFLSPWVFENVCHGSQGPWLEVSFVSVGYLLL